MFDSILTQLHDFLSLEREKIGVNPRLPWTRKQSRQELIYYLILLSSLIEPWLNCQPFRFFQKVVDMHSLNFHSVEVVFGHKHLVGQFDSSGGSEHSCWG